MVLGVLVVAVLVTLGVAALLGLTVAPFLVALWHAERRGASTARAGGAALVGSAVGLVLAVLALRADAVPPAAALPLLLTWVVPVLVARAPSGARPLGRAGLHAR
jgi:hypothetical protein